MSERCWRAVVCCSSKPYVRKKAVLALYKLFLQFPQGLRLSFDALKRRLSDEDTSVCCTLVSVSCSQLTLGTCNTGGSHRLTASPLPIVCRCSWLSLDWVHGQVVSCAVNVICELARKKPKNYLPLAPELFKILTTSRNNWMLIKVVKLLGALVEEEPRLARKLIEPLANHIQTTPAKSLMYECIYAVRSCDLAFALALALALAPALALALSLLVAF